MDRIIFDSKNLDRRVRGEGAKVNGANTTATQPASTNQSGIFSRIKQAALGCLLVFVMVLSLNASAAFRVINDMNELDENETAVVTADNLEQLMGFDWSAHGIDKNDVSHVVIHKTHIMGAALELQKDAHFFVVKKDRTIVKFNNSSGTITKLPEPGTLSWYQYSFSSTQPMSDTIEKALEKKNAEHGLPTTNDRHTITNDRHTITNPGQVSKDQTTNIIAAETALREAKAKQRVAGKTAIEAAKEAKSMREERVTAYMEAKKAAKEANAAAEKEREAEEAVAKAEKLLSQGPGETKEGLLSKWFG